MSINIRIEAKDAWILGANWRPPWLWPRKYPTIARTTPRVWRGTCQRERTICDGQYTEQSKVAGKLEANPKDHARWEDEGEGEGLNGYVNP